MREIIFDTETTGLDPRSGDRLVEIGCVEMVNRVTTGATFHCYFNPDRDMPAAAEAVHGLSATFLSDKPRFHEKAAEFLEFIGDSMLVAHNAGFDFGFVNMELEMCGLDPLSKERMIDTVALARVRHPGAKHRRELVVANVRRHDGWPPVPIPFIQHFVQLRDFVLPANRQAHVIQHQKARLFREPHGIGRVVIVVPCP